MNLSKIILQHILSILVILTLTSCTTKAQYPVLLHEGMVFNISAKGESQRLVDQQYELIKNPPRKNQAILGGFPWDKSFIENGWNRSFLGPFNSPDLYQNQNLYYPIEVIIDLGELAVVTEICFTDLHGEGKLKIEVGKNKAWKAIFENKLKQTFTWSCQKKLSVEGQYIKFTFSDPSANIGEIFLQTQKPLNNTFSKIKETTKSSLPSPSMDRLIGVNINTEDPPYLIAPFSFVREYHDWQLDIGSNRPDSCNVYQWNPCNAYEGWYFDRLYQDLVDNRTTISANLKGSIPALQEHTNEDKPLSKGADPTDPKSYIQHAEYMYQFAARYGHQKISTEYLQSRLGEKAVSGLGLVTYIEDWNEQDKYWMGATNSEQQRAAYFSPFEYAAMLSADYDGHESSLQLEVNNPNCNNTFPIGIKNADRGMKVVMSGISGLNIDYVKGIQLWARMNRKDQQFPADVLNFHHYSNNFDGQSGVPSKGSRGVSPEEDFLYQKLKSIVAYRNKHLPGKELWLSEFGYDVHPQSPQKAPPIGPFTSEEVQAQWIIRSFLAIAAAGFDKAQLFTMTDGYKSNPAQMFSTCGLVELAEEQDPNTPFPEFIPRTVWYYVYTLKNRLKGFRFKRIIPSKVADVNVYEFESIKDTNQKIYAVWVTTSKNHVVKNFRFKASVKVQNATQVVLQDGDIDGISTPLTSQDHHVTLKEVSERPVLVLVNQKIKDVNGCGENITLKPSMLKQENDIEWGNPLYLIDEQFLENGQARQPICGLGGHPYTPWMKITGQHWTRDVKEMSIIIDLEQTHLINGISVFDLNNEGWLRIEYGQPGQWKTWSRYRTIKYKEWKSWFNLNLKTRYIRVVYEDSRAVIGEIILRGDAILK